MSVHMLLVWERWRLKGYIFCCLSSPVKQLLLIETWDEIVLHRLLLRVIAPAF